MDVGESIADRVGDLARGGHQWVAVAESLTGGLLCSRLARVEGSTDWFRGGIVAYSRQVKHHLLAVPPGPVVSEPSVRAMAIAAAELLDADVAVALTGAAGPAPQDGNPPGTVWVGTSASGASAASCHEFSGGPGAVCEQAVLEAVAALERCLRDLARR